MSPGLRSFWLPSAAVAYVCFAALQARRSSILPWLALVGLPVLLAEFWRRTAKPQGGEGHTEPTARSALRAGVWGAAMWLAARSGPPDLSAFDAAANLGAGTAVVATLIALARIGSLGGIVTPHPASRSLDAAALAGLLWGIAAALPATRALLPRQVVVLDPLAVDYATTSAAAGSLLVLVAATWRLKALRKLEMGVGDRASGALALAITAFLVVVPAAALNVAPPDRLLPVGVVVSSLLCTWAATTREPTTVSVALRGSLAALILGAPATLLVGVLARELPQHAGALVLAASGMALVVGLIARAVARPLGPEQSRWLDAIDAASRGALQPEPDAAIRAALMALGKACDTTGARPELWRNHPEEVLRVDIAGYLHADQAAAPERLYALALGEPERTLRAEVLRSLQVRRPDLRPLLAWFEQRRAFSATIVLDEDGPLGFILLPEGSRRSVMALEEARAIRVLADRISALLAVSSALARSRQRELDAQQRVATLEEERQRLEGIITTDAERNRVLPERFADSVRRAAYSAAARLVLDQLERLGRQNAPVAMIAPPGVAAAGYSSVVHLASPRSAGPLVIVDGARSVEHDAERWENPRASPLLLAEGGTLVVLNAAALPSEIQQLLVRRLAHAPSSPEASSVPRPGLVATISAPPITLVEAGRLERSLASWLGESTVELPALADRGEDLRALALDQLARAGILTRGEPLGIDPAALRLLVEHDWPGNDLELADVLVRAATVTTGPVVTPRDLARVDFHPHLERIS